MPVIAEFVLRLLAGWAVVTAVCVSAWLMT